MVKFLKRSLAIFLSVSTLFFRGPVCFGEEPPKEGGFPLSSVVSSEFYSNPFYKAAEGANPMYEAADRSGGAPPPAPSRKPSDWHQPVANGEPVTLLPTSDSTGARDVVSDRRFGARRVQTADVGVYLSSGDGSKGDGSKIAIPTVDFFTCPPRTAKELFEKQDKEAAIAYQDGALHTSAIDRIEADKCCCKRCCGCPQCGCGLFKALLPCAFLLISAATIVLKALELYYTEHKSIPSVFDTSSEISEWNKDRAVDINTYKLAIVEFASYCLLSVLMLYAMCSKACCGCYACKPSHYGCSCGYSCCNDGDKCVGCIGCCDDKCSKECLTCCPCDNGGLAIDWCGSYGSGGCCTGPMYDKDDFIVSVGFFERFINSLGGIEQVRGMSGLSKNDITHYAKILDQFKEYITSNALVFNRSKGGCIMGPPNCMGEKLEQSSGGLDLLRPGAKDVLKLFGSAGTCEADGVVKALLDKCDVFQFTGNKFSGGGKTILDLVNAICGSKIKIEGSDQNDLAEKFIGAVYWLNESTLAVGDSLSQFEIVMLQNSFNFLRALWKLLK